MSHLSCFRSRLNILRAGNSPIRKLRAMAVAAVATLMLAACAGQDEVVDMAADVADAYRQAETAMTNGNYRRAIQIFEVLQARFPFSDLSKQIQLQLMYSYYKLGQEEQAIESADQFLRENPTHPRVDYATYVKGLAYFERDRGLLERWFRKSIDSRPPHDGELAFSLFSRLVERYPASEYAEDARQRMIYLKNRLAAYENSVARFYIKNDAYVAALNRAKGALEKYHGAESNLESLELMIAAYEGLGMTELADDTRRVLAENTPTSASNN